MGPPPYLQMSGSRYTDFQCPPDSSQLNEQEEFHDSYRSSSPRFRTPDGHTRTNKESPKLAYQRHSAVGPTSLTLPPEMGFLSASSSTRVPHTYELNPAVSHSFDVLDSDEKLVNAFLGKGSIQQ
ncbi:hypothetical protein N7540_003363 [Penicillium herquei]|nr:hypothetical protein N7540_003363 [Penicillium herquei]